LNDLKQVARSLSLAQNGRKADVADRIKRYLQTGRDSRDNIRVMAISQIVQDAMYGRSLPAYESLYMQIRQAQFNNGTGSGNGSGGSSQGGLSHSNSSQDSLPRSQTNPRRPWLFFKENPFFVLKKLVTPNAGYCFKAPDTRGTCRVNFVLNEQDTELLKSSAKYKLYLLCGVYDKNKPSTDALIEFPQPLEIHFNGNLVKDNVKGLKNKPGTARPANLTPFISTPNHTNNLELVYAFTKQDYLIFCYLIEEVAPEKLLQKVLSNPHIAKQKTLHEFQNSEDDDIQEMSTILSLKCPLSFARFKYPTKSIACKHLPCFDALSFIYLQEQASTWTCPVCSIPVRVKDLAIDDYVMDIMKNTSDDVETVEIDLEGSWKPIYEDGDNHTRNYTPHPKTPTPALKKEDSASASIPVPASNSPIIISLDSDDEEEEVSQPTQQQEQHQQAPPSASVSESQEVELEAEPEAPQFSPPRLQRRPPPQIDTTDSSSPGASQHESGGGATSASSETFSVSTDQRQRQQQREQESGQYVRSSAIVESASDNPNNSTPTVVHRSMSNPQANFDQHSNQQQNPQLAGQSQTPSAAYNITSQGRKSPPQDSPTNQEDHSTSHHQPHIQPPPPPLSPPPPPQPPQPQQQNHQNYQQQVHTNQPQYAQVPTGVMGGLVGGGPQNQAHHQGKEITVPVNAEQIQHPLQRHNTSQESYHSPNLNSQRGQIAERNDDMRPHQFSLERSQEITPGTFDLNLELEKIEQERQKMLKDRERLQNEHDERVREQILQQYLTKEKSLGLKIQMVKERASMDQQQARQRQALQQSGAQEQHQQQSQAIQSIQRPGNGNRVNTAPVPPSHSQRFPSQSFTLPPIRPQNIVTQANSHQANYSSVPLPTPVQSGQQPNNNTSSQSPNSESDQFFSPISIPASTSPPIIRSTLMNPPMGNTAASSESPISTRPELARKPSEAKSAYEAEKDEIEQLKRTLAKASRSASENSSPKIAPAVPAHQRFDRLSTRIPGLPYREIRDSIGIYNGYVSGHGSTASVPHISSQGLPRANASVQQPAVQSQASPPPSTMTNLSTSQYTQTGQNLQQQQMRLQQYPPIAPAEQKRSVSNPDALNFQTTEQANLRESLSQYQQRNGLNRANTINNPQIHGNSAALDNIQRLTKNIASHVAKSSSSNNLGHRVETNTNTTDGSNGVSVSSRSSEKSQAPQTDSSQTSQLPQNSNLNSTDSAPKAPIVSTFNADKGQSLAAAAVADQQPNPHTSIPVPNWSANNLLRPHGTTQFSPSRFAPTQPLSENGQPQREEANTQSQEGTKGNAGMQGNLNINSQSSLPPNPALTGGLLGINVDPNSLLKKREENTKNQAAANSISSTTSSSPNSGVRPPIPNVFIPPKRPGLSDKKRVSSQQPDSQQSSKRPTIQRPDSNSHNDDVSASGVIDLTSDVEDD